MSGDGGAVTLEMLVGASMAGKDRGSPTNDASAKQLQLSDEDQVQEFIRKWALERAKP